MKIAFILDVFSIGGIETVAKNYITLLNKQGHEIDLYVLHKNETDMTEFLPSDVSFISLNFDRTICPELYSYGVMNWWWGKYAYALIHPILTLGLKIRKFFTSKKSYDVAIAFSGHINDLTFLTEGFVKAKQKICWCHGTLLSYLAICDGYSKLYKKVDKIVTLSEQGLQNVYAGHKYLYDKKIANIYNPVFIKGEAIDELHISELKEKYQDYVLMIARVLPPKDHKTAIDALVELHTRGLKKHIVFLGDGEKIEELEKYAKDKKIFEWCHFEGNRRDVSDYIVASHINLLASHYEGLPTVMIEAMAYGKPCIMTDCDGGEVTEHGKYGILVPIEDDVSIADALEKLFTDRDMYSKYSKLANERYKDFEPEEIMKRFEFLLEE